MVHRIDRIEGHVMPVNAFVAAGHEVMLSFACDRDRPAGLAALLKVTPGMSREKFSH